MLVGWTGRARGGAQPQGDFLVLQVPAAQEVGVLVMELGVLVVGGNATQSGPGRVHPAGQPPSVSQW